MKKALLALSFLIVTAQAFAQLNYTQELSRLAKVSFPDTPSFSTPIPGMSSYTYTNGVIAYVAAVSPASSGLKNVVSNKSLNSLYDDFIEGNLNSASGKLIYKKEVSIQNLKGLQFSYQGKTVSSQAAFYAYQQVVYLNDTLFTYAIISPKELKADDENIKAFFTSFKLKVKAGEVTQDPDHQLASKTGEFIGKFAANAVVMVVIGGIIFLIVRLSNRKKQRRKEDFK